jgi:hypothetical protein
MAALGSTTAERQHMNKAYSHNDHHWGITIKIKRRYQLEHVYDFLICAVLGCHEAS